MFNKFWDQSSVSKVKQEKQWSTEKELILLAIEKYDSLNYKSKFYYDNASEEWKVNSDYISSDHYKKAYSKEDDRIFKHLASECADEDILRALFNRHEVDGILVSGYHFLHSPFIENTNLPADIIDKLCEKYRCCNSIIREMPRVGYKYITEETKAKIDAAVAELDAKIRKKKENVAKQKLTAFLTTAAATKSVLTGSSIDDVVEQTITSDVDDAVLNYMSKLFDK